MGQRPNYKMQDSQNITGENLDNLGFGDDFLDEIPKAHSMKEIIDKLEFIKI